MEDDYKVKLSTKAMLMVVGCICVLLLLLADEFSIY